MSEFMGDVLIGLVLIAVAGGVVCVARKLGFTLMPHG